MCTQTIPLPQIRRVNSGEIRDEWKRMTNSQRRFSFDYQISQTISSKNKSVLKVQKISSTKPLINKQSISSGVRAKSSFGRIALKASNAVPVTGDHQTLLDGSQILELVYKSQNMDSLSNYGANDLIKINSKRYELEKVLRLKCMSCIRDECLDHLLKANALIKELREIYFEDNFKLNVIKSNKSDDKRKLKVLDSFVKSCFSRINFCEETDQKSSSWISLTTNANRLMDVTHIRPNDEGLELVLLKTIDKLKFSRICCIGLVRIIIEINIEIMTLFIDSLPSQSISQMCLLIENFNRLFVCNQIKALDLIKVVALRQAKVTTNKFLYYLYNEINKNFELIHQKENLSNYSSRNQLESEDITSDYFSASSNSTVFYRKNKTSSFDSKFSKDFKIVFNILIQSNQRVLLKIIFGHQDKNDQNETKIPGYRQKWFKASDVSHEKQQRICKELDRHFWDIFWLEFNNLMKSCLCFCETNCISLPISVLCNPSKAQVIHILLKAFIRSEELLDEAIKSLEFSYLNLSLKLSLYKYSQNYSKILKFMNKSILTIERRKVDNKIGTLLGLSLIDCIETLIEVKLNFKGCLNEYEMILDNIVTNILNMFVAFVEAKQSTELDYKVLEFITVSILDINNLVEVIESDIESKPINETIKTLKNIKENALIKSKEFVFDKSYEIISKSIPLKDYRRKICSSNSEWIEKIVSTLLQPITDLLSDSSFDGNILLSTLIEEFSKGFLKSVFKEKRIQMRFSHSGALQFNKDVNTFWDWMVTNNIQSTDISSITQLKTLSFSLVNRDIPISTAMTRHNRINPQMTLIQSNQNDHLHDSEPRLESKFFSCLSFMMCSHH